METEIPGRGGHKQTAIMTYTKWKQEENIWLSLEGSCWFSPLWMWLWGANFWAHSSDLPTPLASIMEADNCQVTTVFTVQPSFHIGTWQTEYHDALPSSANMQSHLTSSIANEGNASWYSVCQVPMVEWRLDCENCRHLTVVGLCDTCPWRQYTNTFGQKTLKWAPSSRGKLLNYSGWWNSQQPPVWGFSMVITSNTEEEEVTGRLWIC